MQFVFTFFLLLRYFFLANKHKDLSNSLNSTNLLTNNAILKLIGFILGNTIGHTGIHSCYKQIFFLYKYIII